MAAAAAAAATEREEEILEVRCAGCGETLEVERGLTEFICPDCSTAQALPPELMPPRPPRRRRALPIPSAPPWQPPVRLPCGACGALLSVPPGLARCGCPVCGAELAVDAVRLRQYLLSTAAAPLVPVSLPPVFQAREVQQEYPDSAVRVGHIRRDPNNQPIHVDRSQIGCQNIQACLEYPNPDIDRDDIDTEMLNEINVMHSHRSGFSVGARTVGAKRRQVEALNLVTYQEHAQQSNYSVNAERPDRTIYAGEASNESLNHAIHRDVGHIELIKEKTVVRHSNQIAGTPVGPKTVNVKKSQVETLNQITRQVQKQPSCSTICAEYAAVPYPDQVTDSQEAQIDPPVNRRGDGHVQMNNRIGGRDANRRNGYSISHEAISAKEKQVEVVNRATKQAPKQHFDTMVHAKHALTDHSDQVMDPMHHATNEGEECVQQRNESVAKHSKRQSGHFIGVRNINVEERYVEPMKQLMQEAEEQPADYISHTTQVHGEPSNDGVVWLGSKKIGIGAEPSSPRRKKKWTMPTEQLISAEQEHTPLIDDTQTEHTEADLRKQAPGRTQKRKKGSMMVSNNGLQLRRSKRLAPESDAVVDTRPLHVDPPEPQAASPYQNLSDLPDIDGIIANLCPGLSLQLEIPQLRSSESETLNLATSPASNSYLESHNEAIIKPDMHKTRVEVEPGLVYLGPGKTGPPKLLSPTEQELEHPNNNIQTEQDEVEMGQVTIRLAHKRTRRNLMSSSNEGFEHRRSKRLAKQPAAITYCESAESKSEDNQAASPSQSMSDYPDIDQLNDDSSSSSLPKHNIPPKSTNEADDLHVTTQSASSIPNMSDPETFARYYSKIYPPEVRRALEKNPNLWLERLIHQNNPSSYLHYGGKENKRRSRGPTLCLKVWTTPEGVRIPVSLNDLGQPIGNEAATLSSFLGTLARDGTLAPLTYSDWRRFPEKNKDVMWHIVNLKFIIAPIGEIWAMKALGKKWKDWKAILKHERYDVHETDEERLADRDSRVPEEQWKLLVAYWGTEKAKAASARCKASQAQQTLRRHRTGSKSFARIREEERQKRPNKEEPSRTDIFILTHTPKDGKGRPIDKGTADVICRLREEAQKRQEGLASDSMDVFTKVVGPDTRDTKRTYGSVLCTSELRGKTAAKVSLRQAQEAKRKAEEEATTLRKKMMEMEETNRKLKEDLANAKSPGSSGVKDRRMMSTGDLQKNQHVNH